MHLVGCFVRSKYITCYKIVTVWYPPRTESGNIHRHIYNYIRLQLKLSIAGHEAGITQLV